MTYTDMELGEVIWVLSEVQAAAQRGEPIKKATAKKLKHAHSRLDYIIRILVAGGLIAIGVFLAALLAVHVHNVLAPSDAKTPPQLESR